MQSQLTQEKSIEDGRSIVLSIPSRGRAGHLRALVDRLAATKSERTKVVVVLNGKESFLDPGYPGIYFVHLGDIPTIPVAVNFGWYALRRPNSILVKLDNDIDPPDDWEHELLSKSRAADLGGFLCVNEFQPTQVITLRGHEMRRPHTSHTWGMPFIYGGFLWIAPQIAQTIQFIDERFVRSNDGDLGERVSRIPGATIAYSTSFATHMSPGTEGRTEADEIATEMYQTCDLLIKALPVRPLMQETIWSACLTPEEAERSLAAGFLPKNIEAEARHLLRAKLIEAFELVGRRALVDSIFDKI
jgi:hypothetical protein